MANATCTCAAEAVWRSSEAPPRLPASLSCEGCYPQWPSELVVDALQEYHAQARAAHRAARIRAAEAASRANETPMPTAAGQRRFRQEMPALLNDHERPGLVSRFTHTGPEFVETRGDVEVGGEGEGACLFQPV